MAGPTPLATGGNTSAGQASGGMAMVIMVTFLFFAWGFSTVLIDAVIPKLKAVFQLTYAEAMLTQFCFFLGYFVFSIPAGYLLARIGYMRGIIAGLGVMTAGCLLFSPAAASGHYEGFLGALFILAAGITILQVAANPLMAGLGPAETSHSRLTLAQAFNSFGTFIGPFVGSILIFGAAGANDAPVITESMDAAATRAVQADAAHAVQLPFLGISGFLVLLALLFFFNRNAKAPKVDAPENLLAAFSLMRHPRLAFGVVCIFLYVGAEVAIGSLMANYLGQERVLGIAEGEAVKMVSLYWGGAMIGRLIGAFALRVVRPGYVLAFCALAAAGLAAVSSFSMGWAAAGTLIAIGLFNSIMFPTIFTLALEGLGARTPQGSGLLCMAIVGGAIVPYLTGVLADNIGLALALFLPVACYVLIALYGISTGKTKAVIADTPITDPGT